MATAAAAPTSRAAPTGAGISGRIRALWTRLSALPGGKLLFSRLLGFMAPYTGSIAPRIVELRPGYARVEMRDRRAVRNHLKSIHAIALANLAEAASGLAVIYGLPDDVRGILTGFSIEYLKKARGPLVAECDQGTLDLGPERREYEIEVLIRDRAGDVVARARPRWLIGPAQSRG
ncbi:MAG TPA: hotdog fold domain-containing protein [Gemmatimonadaceae bacterium]|nr:hotdog fold domain-containing protein [Gemmatimonadaceae bacterium]